MTKTGAKESQEDFKAGVNWQKEQVIKKGYLPPEMVQDLLDMQAKHIKEDMMKEAVEGDVRKAGTIGYFEFSNEQQFHSLLEKFQDCDKVHVIIIKKED